MKFSKSNKKKSKGISMLEVIVAVFVFELVMSATAFIFVKTFIAAKNAKGNVKNMENAQYALNSLAKNLRTSSVLLCDSDGDGLEAPNHIGDTTHDTDCSATYATNHIRLYNHSLGVCAEYKIANNRVQVKSATMSLDNCKTDPASTAGFLDILNVYVKSGGFAVKETKSASASLPKGEMGKATIFLEICSSSACSSEDSKVNIQTSVSLRDYISSR